MKIAAPSFSEIIEKNKIIKGRLSFEEEDLEGLYLSLIKDNNRLKKQQTRHEEVIKSNITKRNGINFQIKRNSESVQKSFYPSMNKISLIYKKQGEFFYIKARFYWIGKQREVQVGSVPNVITTINSMVVKKLFSGLKIIKVKNLTWGKINKHPILLDAIKEIASLKAQEYILRRLMKNKLNIIDENVREDKNIILGAKEKRLSSIKPDPVNEKEDQSIGGVEWYEKWRRDNL